MSANNDPEAFSHPEKFDIARQPNRHVAFGSGIRYCLGAPLARLEATTVIGALLDRWPGIDFAADPSDLEWSPGFFLRGVRRLPVSV